MKGQGESRKEPFVMNELSLLRYGRNAHRLVVLARIGNGGCGGARAGDDVLEVRSEGIMRAP